MPSVAYYQPPMDLPSPTPLHHTLHQVDGIAGWWRDPCASTWSIVISFIDGCQEHVMSEVLSPSKARKESSRVQTLDFRKADMGTFGEAGNFYIKVMQVLLGLCMYAAPRKGKLR